MNELKEKLKEKINKKIIIIFITIAILILIDQVIKSIVLNNMYQSSIVVINNFLNLTYVENTGGAFGIGNNSTLFFIIVNIVIIGVLVKLLFSKKDDLSIFAISSIALIISGGIGNLIDRIFRGFVIDYIDINPIIKYPVFNFADICIVLGVIILGIDLIIHRNKL